MSKLVLYRGKWCLYSRDSSGSPIRRSLGTSDHSEAERRAADLQAFELLRTASNVRTIAEAWEARRKALEGRRTASNMEWSGKPILSFFGHMEPRHVTKEMVKSYVELRKSHGKKPWTIHTELSHLRSTLHSVKADTSSIVLETPPPKHDYLTKAQAKAFLDACTYPHVRTFVLIALGTGARTQAILDLTWSRVDLTHRTIDFRTDKDQHRKTRTLVPINNQLLAELEKLPRASATTHVIEWAGSKVQSVKKGIKAVAKKVNLPFVSPHVFRHSAAVWMAEAGVSMEEIAQFLGHSNPEITRKVYARYSPTYLRKAAEALEL